MRIEKIKIYNYKCFDGWFTAHLNNGVNILVGDNEAGKSTILEAANLALTGILQGRYLKNELSQYLFNHNVACNYIGAVKKGENPHLPEICIEIYFDTDKLPLFEGNRNSEKVKACGIFYKIEFDSTYQSEYERLISVPEELTTIPIEYYKITWKSFARDSLTARSIPVKSVMIDSSSNRYQSGSDIYISRIIRDDLEDSEKVKLSQAYRKMKDSFSQDESIKAINKKIDEKAKISEKTLKVCVDLSTQNSWESVLMTYLDNIPFHQIGKGEQCVIKTNLALGHKKSKEANLILLEEPENHLSHTKLNELIKNITDGCLDKQIIISTHSSYVSNKLGLENLLLLHDQNISRLSDLKKDTFDFFKKLPGYQTLRLILCKKAVLVEGDSDELIFQRAYMDSNDGRLPIEGGVDVISVKLTFERFLEIAENIKKPVAVITDNDGDYDTKIIKKYKAYEESDCIIIFADKRNELNTLEPQFVDANKEDPKKLCDVIGVSCEDYTTPDVLSKYMESNKTKWALKVFESKDAVKYPEYIKKAASWCNE